MLALLAISFATEKEAKVNGVWFYEAICQTLDKIAVWLKLLLCVGESSKNT